MKSARLKASIFKSADQAYITTPERSSTYAGFQNNPGVPCRVKNRDVSKVFINGTWWDVDPTEWVIVNCGDMILL